MKADERVSTVEAPRDVADARVNRSAEMEQIADRLEAMLAERCGAPRSGDASADQRAVVTRLPLLGELMVERGLISADELRDALEIQRATRKRLGETLIAMGAVSRADMALVLAEQIGVPFTDVRTRPPDVVVAALIPEDFARRYGVLAVEQRDDGLVVAMSDPKDVFALDDLRLLTGQRIMPTLADPEQLAAAIDRAYQNAEIESTVGDTATDFGHEDEDDDDDVESVEATAAPVVRLANALLDQAITDRASDIHIEPLADSVRVRFRIDGLLQTVSEAPLTVLRPLVSRLKVLGGMDIAQTRLPQDGRFSLSASGRVVDVRLETIPTRSGEAVVLRLLDAVRGITKVSELDLSEDELARLVPAFHAPQGAVIVTGPTGSGKSSTVYAMLADINTDEKSIVSVEDPIEYRIDGVKQMQINTRAGMTFAKALRSLLRADPDVMFIGEVRDGETARIAADAATTGHLVLSTLHTTRAAAAPTRLIDMGVEPYLVGASLTCVVAQRLARKLCSHCAVSVPVTAEMLRGVGASEALLESAPNFRVPKGCPQCRDTGYSGRVALFEIMTVSEELARLIVNRAPTADVERLAVEQGMQTLRQSALRRVLDGTLSTSEMLRVVS